MIRNTITLNKKRKTIKRGQDIMKAVRASDSEYLKENKLTYGWRNSMSNKNKKKK